MAILDGGVGFFCGGRVPREGELFLMGEGVKNLMEWGRGAPYALHRRILVKRGHIYVNVLPRNKNKTVP